MSCCAANFAMEAHKYDEGAKQEQLLASAHRTQNGSLQSDFLVPSMHCASCIRTIENGLQDLKGVQNARANLSTRRVSVTWEQVEGQQPDFISELKRLGFEATVFDLGDVSSEIDSAGRHLLLCLAVAGFAAANIMLLSVSMWSGASEETAKLFQLISGLIAVPAVLFAGQPFFTSALGAVRSWRLNMDVPISLAVLLALSMSMFESLFGTHETYFDAAVMLLFFLLIGRYLDHMMRDRARSAVMHLARLMPNGAVVIDDQGSTSYYPLSEVCVGDTLLVAAGERIPLNGKIVEGCSDLDCSLVTGESTPVSAHKGQKVEAGVLNLTGPLRIVVTHQAETSFVAEVMEMMEAAEQSQSHYVRIADRAAALYAPAVHLLALMTFVGWMIVSGGQWQLSLYTAIAVLIITCPCALGLAVPIAQVVAANRMFRAGLLVKDGAALEKLCDVDWVLFDKTGTLTLGVPHINDIQGGTQQERGVARALASLSSHPMARAVAELESSEQHYELTAVREHPGFGIESVWDEKRIRLGRRSWVGDIAGSTETHTNGAHSEVCFAVEGGALTSYSVTDTLREGAVETLQTLKEQGYDVEILSGDRHRAVAGLAGELGNIPFSAELKPADKIARINALQDRGHKVLYVGDGLNDAPAMAGAYVSIAPSTGVDVGRQSADLVFTGRGLGAVSFAFLVGRQTNRIVWQNFAIAVLYNLIAIPIAVSGHVTPLIAAIAMSGSSLVVVANSLRLNIVSRNKQKPEKNTKLNQVENLEVVL